MDKNKGITNMLQKMAEGELFGCCGPPPALRSLFSERAGKTPREVSMANKTIRLKIRGMTCDGCAQTVSRYLKREKGVAEVSVRWKEGLGEVTFDPKAIDEAGILRSQVFQGPYSARLAE